MPMHFPPLNAEMQAHTQAALLHIRTEIEKAGGLISFEHYMNLALYSPGLGYYSSGTHKLGRMGDFVTAPELSPLFAKCLARQFKQVFQTISEKNILELGAGSGAFARDVLLELDNTPYLPDNYFILETSADLRQRQRQRLESECPHLLSRVQWLDCLPPRFKGIIFANEVLDALPVHCFRIEQGQAQERGVTVKNGQLGWALSPPLSPEFKEGVNALVQEYQLPEGFESEINLLLPPWVQALADLLDEGLMIFFDYGYGRQEYYHPDQHGGSLRCYFQHRCHKDPFLFPGLQDLTCSVDFTSVVESAYRAGMRLAGYTTQSAFLLAMGIGDFMQLNPQNQALKTLMLPSEMGTLVKAMALSKNWEGKLDGFNLFDKRREL